MTNHLQQEGNLGPLVELQLISSQPLQDVLVAGVVVTGLCYVVEYGAVGALTAQDIAGRRGEVCRAKVALTAPAEEHVFHQLGGILWNLGWILDHTEIFIYPGVSQ